MKSAIFIIRVAKNTLSLFVINFVRGLFRDLSLFVIPRLVIPRLVIICSRPIPTVVGRSVAPERAEYGVIVNDNGNTPIRSNSRCHGYHYYYLCFVRQTALLARAQCTDYAAARTCSADINTYETGNVYKHIICMYVCIYTYMRMYIVVAIFSVIIIRSMLL